MQETLIKQTFQAEQFHTRLWWMEVIRGVVNIIFGIILLTHMGETIDTNADRSFWSTIRLNDTV